MRTLFIPARNWIAAINSKPPPLVQVTVNDSAHGRMRPAVRDVIAVNVRPTVHRSLPLFLGRQRAKLVLRIPEVTLIFHDVKEFA